MGRLGVSLLISVYERTEIFRRAYPTWFENKTYPDEVIILNDGADTSLLDIVDEMADKYREVSMRYIHRRKENVGWKNPAIPHNFLVKEAKHSIVLIIDPETVFVNDGLPILKDFYQNKVNRSSSCSACRIYHVQNESKVDGWSTEQITTSSDITTDPSNPNANAIIYRPCTPAHEYRAWWQQRYVDLGGKDERYTGWGYEDLDMHHRQQRLHPVGKDACLDDITIVVLGHSPADMTGAGTNQELWNEEGSKGIPEDGVANKGKEWGKIQIEEEYKWD